MDSISRSDNSTQSASLLLKTTAAAEEIKRLVHAEKLWNEERSEWHRKTVALEQRMLQQTSRIKVLEEHHTAQASSWRKDKELLDQEIENVRSQNIALRRALETKSQAEVITALRRFE